MSVYLGQVKSGSRYTIELRAPASNNGVTIANVGWVPTGGTTAHNFPTSVAPGGTASHQETCPPDTEYQAIMIDIDIPGAPSHAFLTWIGLVGPMAGQPITVLADERYWAQVVP